MQRDMNLVRQILFAIEAAPTGEAPHPLKIDGFSDTQIGYHVWIMKDAGLVDAIDMSGPDSDGPQAVATQMLWAGHEFLDAARDDTRWKHAIAFVKEKAGSVTIAVLQQLLVSMMQASLHRH